MRAERGWKSRNRVRSRCNRERKQVVVSAFSSNLVSPQGELDLSVAAALLVFRRALEGNPNIVRIDECMAPNHEGCSSN
jgi:hypothetical protein